MGATRATAAVVGSPWLAYKAKRGEDKAARAKKKRQKAELAANKQASIAHNRGLRTNSYAPGAYTMAGETTTSRLLG